MGRRVVWTSIICLTLALGIAPTARCQSYTIATVAGAGVPSNVQGKSASFGWTSPRFLTADPLGNVYFVDLNAIVRWDAASGLLTIVAGSAANGYSGDNGPAANALLDTPQGLAIDSSGALYVADAGNYVIRRISQGIITTVAGNGSQGTSCANGPALGIGLNSPFALAVDSSGNLYISDENLNCVRKVSNGQISTVAGAGTAGLRGDGGPATSALLSAPLGVAVDTSGNLYIADSFNGRIREVAVGTGTITTVAGGSTCGTCYTGPATSVSLSLNGGLTVDSSGNLYFSNGYNVSKVSNGVVSVLAGSTTHAGFAGDGGPVANALLAAPEAVALDAAGNLYIADENNYRIREVSLGAISTIVGNGSVGDNGPATQAQLYSTAFLALDAADNLYIGDSTMSAVRKVSAANGTITTYANRFGEVDGLAVDSAGNLYVADSAAQEIWEFSDGSRSVFAGVGQLGYNPGAPAADAKMWGPFGLAVDSAGNFYLSDTTQAPGSGADLDSPRPNASYIDKISNGILTTIGGNGPGNYNGDGQSGLNTAFNSPAGVAVDKAGDVFISDAANYRIREISSNTGTVSTVAGSGVQGYGGDGGPALDAKLNLVRSGYPFVNTGSGVAVDQAGNIYFADTYNSRVRKVTASTGIITTIAGTGRAGYSGDYGPATSAELSYPQGIAVDAAGNVFVADGRRVRVLTPSTATGCTYSVSSTSLSSSISGGNVTVNVQTTAYCLWAVSGLPSWIAISGAANGTGPGSVTISVSANTGVARSATITIAGQPITITQSGAVVGPAIALVVNAESGATVLAPNTWMEILGSDLAPAGDSRAWAASDFVGNQMPTNLDGVSVTVNGVPAYIYYISPTQVNVLTPPGALPASVQVVLTNGGTPSAAFSVGAQAESLSFFVFNGPYVAATHANGNLIGPVTLYPGLSTPATPGETIVIYANGFGATSAPVTAGAVAQSGTLSPLPSVTIGGMPATVTFAGLVAPGEFQFNVVVPAGLTAGDQPIAASYAGSSTQSGTLLTIQ